MKKENLVLETENDCVFNYVEDSENCSYSFEGVDLDNEIGMLLGDIRKYPLLTNDETLVLFDRMHNGDFEARQTLINSNLRLVASVAKQYLNRGLDYDDLIVEGVFGLTRAIEKFDPKMGNKLSTYAVRWINQSIGRALITTGKPIRLPVNVHDDCIRILKAKTEYFEKYGINPTDEELAEILDGKLTLKQIKKLKDIFVSTSTDSLDKEIGEDLCLYDVVSSDYEDEYSDMVRNDTDDLVSKMLSSLDYKSAIVLTKCFGLNGEPEQTLEQIGQQFGITRERVRQIKEFALKKLREGYGTRIKELTTGGAY